SQRVLINVLLYGQTILEAHLFDGKIIVQQFNLCLQGHLLIHAVLQCHAKEIAQPENHFLGRCKVPLLHEYRNPVQGIEQELRVNLLLQGIQAGLYQGGFRPAGILLFLTYQLHVTADVETGDKQHIDDEVGQDERVSHHQVSHVFPAGIQLHVWRLVRYEILIAIGNNCQVDENEGHHEKDVHNKRLEPAVGMKGKLLDSEHQRRRHEQPGQPDVLGDIA